MQKNFRLEIFSLLFKHAGECADINPLLNDFIASDGFSASYLVVMLKALRSNELINFDESSPACDTWFNQPAFGHPVRVSITPDGIAEYHKLQRMKAGWQQSRDCCMELVN